MIGAVRIPDGAHHIGFVSHAASNFHDREMPLFTTEDR